MTTASPAWTPARSRSWAGGTSTSSSAASTAASADGNDSMRPSPSRFTTLPPRLRTIGPDHAVVLGEEGEGGLVARGVT